jgi:hypothetical protein
MKLSITKITLLALAPNSSILKTSHTHRLCSLPPSGVPFYAIYAALAVATDALTPSK